MVSEVISPGWGFRVKSVSRVSNGIEFAFEVGAKEFMIVGGDDGTKVDFQPIEQHPGFLESIMTYDRSANSWRAVGEAPAGHVTAPTVRWGDQHLIVSGEIRLGVRSPDVWSLRIDPRK